MLETLYIVVDGPVNNWKVTFQKLNNVAGPEGLGSPQKWHALLFLNDSLLEVQHKGSWKDLKLRIVNIDIENELKFERRDKKTSKRKGQRAKDLNLNKDGKETDKRK